MRFPLFKWPPASKVYSFKRVLCSFHLPIFRQLFWNLHTRVAQQHRFVLLEGAGLNLYKSEQWRRAGRCKWASHSAFQGLGWCCWLYFPAECRDNGIWTTKGSLGAEEHCTSCLVRVSPRSCNWEFRHKTQLLFHCSLQILSVFPGSIKGTVQCLPNKCISGTACAVTGASGWCHLIQSTWKV